MKLIHICTSLSAISKVKEAKEPQSEWVTNMILQNNMKPVQALGDTTFLPFGTNIKTD